MASWGARLSAALWRLSTFVLRATHVCASSPRARPRGEDFPIRRRKSDDEADKPRATRCDRVPRASRDVIAL
eukprot:5619464-Prymnesium_polylepis.1